MYRSSTRFLMNLISRAVVAGLIDDPKLWTKPSVIILVLAVSESSSKSMDSKTRESCSLYSPFFIHNAFSTSRRFDVANERLPTYVPATNTTLESTFPAPSTRPRSPTPQQSFTRAASPGFLYRDAEDDDEIRQLADRVSRIRSGSGRHHGAKRYDTDSITNAHNSPHDAVDHTDAKWNFSLPSSGRRLL